MPPGAPPPEGGRELRLPRLLADRRVWLAAVGAAALLLVAVVTASGPVDLVTQPQPGTGPPPSATQPPVTMTTPPSTAGGAPPVNLEDLPSLPPVVVTAIQLAFAGLALWLLYLLGRLVWRRAPRLHSRVVTRPRLTPLPPVPDELVETADQRLALLREGTPRNAIVACWVDLEERAAAAGLPRHAYETAAEYTIRVLHTWDIAPDAMGGLAELYREARYSRHPLTEAHREEAVARLQVIHADVARAAQSQARAQAEEAEMRDQLASRSGSRSVAGGGR